METVYRKWTQQSYVSLPMYMGLTRAKQLLYANGKPRFDQLVNANANGDTKVKE